GSRTHHAAFTQSLSRDRARDNARSSRWTNSAESELTALRHVKALVQVLSERRSQDAFRHGAVTVIETQQRLRGDGDLEVDQLLAVILRAARRLVFVDRAEHLGERSDPT